MPHRPVTDDELRRELLDAADRIPLAIDVDRAWDLVLDELELDERRRRLPQGNWLVAIAAACIGIVLLARPVIVPITTETIRIVGVLVDPPATTVAPDPTPRPTVAPTTTTTSTTAPPPTTTTAPPPPTTTTIAPTGDVAHTAILDDDAYRLTVRAVHDQINAAIGYGHNDLSQLDGAPERLERLLGQDPDLDDELRTTIDLLRRAVAESERGWAIYAHRIVEDIERQRAAR
jgi:hypothetical protein